MNNLLTVSLRQQAMYVPAASPAASGALSPTTGLLVANLANLGFGLSEPLLNALNHAAPAYHARVLDTLREVMGVRKNWTPLVKGWDVPTGESVADHFLTFVANVFQTKGTRLPCGHVIPAGTFPLERYNGCPFCGTPFEFGSLENYKQNSQTKVLDLWTDESATAYLRDLLQSKTALDATQVDSLKRLLAELPLPVVAIGMKETVVAVIDSFVERGEARQAQALFASPTDVLRYLWYKHTGFLQLVEPKTILARQSRNARNLRPALDQSATARLQAAAQLKLKYSRPECARVATWLNGLDLDAEQMCEAMHPKRGMWVRFIRALRLAEWAKRPGFEKLREVLDKFYRQDYVVWQGWVNHYRLRYAADQTLGLLKQRPGLFARSLFANLLWFGPEATSTAFAEVIDRVPARLVATLAMVAETYFSPAQQRAVKPLGGVTKVIPANRLLEIYDEVQLEAMKDAVRDLCLLAVKTRFMALKTEARTMFIDPLLDKIPLSIGDRAEGVQDLPSALMGTRFALEGDTVRLFMQWGAGLPAQHLDMDLSCHVAFEHTSEICSYARLVATGCKHSGDIRSIPKEVGTAEYIDLDLTTLQRWGARYVTFTCNAYSNGSLTPNLVVGWMNSRHPMKISEKTGVAYDPSCVQHQVRVLSPLAKGLVFGVLDVANREIVWLEMPFGGQVVQGLDLRAVQALLAKLSSKLSIGRLLRLKAEAQGLALRETPDADEVYTATWARNTAAVTQLLVD